MVEFNRQERTIRVKIAYYGPAVGGKTTPAWAQGLKFDGFKTFKPDYGKDASQKTEAFIAYDAENFYFAFRCCDSEPSKVKAAISKRDTILPGRHRLRQHRHVQRPAERLRFHGQPQGHPGRRHADDERQRRSDFRTVWYSAGRIDEQGWTAEARIPLKSIRFPSRDVLTWRILFIRFFTRTSEQVTFPPFDPNYGSLLGQAQPFGLSGLKYKRVAELLPLEPSPLSLPTGFAGPSSATWWLDGSSEGRRTQIP